MKVSWSDISLQIPLVKEISLGPSKTGLGRAKERSGESIAVNLIFSTDHISLDDMYMVSVIQGKQGGNKISMEKSKERP